MENGFLNSGHPEGSLLNHVQVILAEKRTSLAMLRTGIAVFALPLGVLGLLISTSKLYDIHAIWHLLLPLLGLCTGLVVLGIFLVTRSVLRIRNYDAMLTAIKKQSPSFAAFLD